MRWFMTSRQFFRFNQPANLSFASIKINNLSLEIEFIKIKVYN